MLNFIMNGQGHGDLGVALAAQNMDPNLMRPYLANTNMGQQNVGYVTVNTRGPDGKMTPKARPVVVNANSTLRKEEWEYLDRTVMLASRQRLKAWADLRAANSFAMPNGMGHTVLQTQAMSDPGEASISMEANPQSSNDRPLFDLTNLPLPIIHSEFTVGMRELATSRNFGQGLDFSMAEACSRRVAESVERLTIGSLGSYTFGGGSVYGYTNYPYRITATITSPTAVGWVPATLINEVLAMRKASQDAKHYGPWVIYNGLAWDQYLDVDYSAAKGDNTLRDRLKKINGVSDVRTLDFLSGYDLIMVQMTSDVCRAVVGADLTTIQWESRGGLNMHFLVMCICVSQMRKDFYGNTGLVHATVAP